MMKKLRFQAFQGLLALLLAAVMTGVFLLYQQPEFVVPLSDLFWGCF
jgi:hypothetical protein